MRIWSEKHSGTLPSVQIEGRKRNGGRKGQERVTGRKEKDREEQIGKDKSEKKNEGRKEIRKQRRMEWEHGKV